MTRSIEIKRSRIAAWIKAHPEEGHPHYWCGGSETDCGACNMDHPMAELYLAMLGEERELLHPAQTSTGPGE